MYTDWNRCSFASSPSSVSKNLITHLVEKWVGLSDLVNYYWVDFSRSDGVNLIVESDRKLLRLNLKTKYCYWIQNLIISNNEKGQKV